VGFYLGATKATCWREKRCSRFSRLTPDYEDVWDRFETVYHNPKIWRRADQSLARHPSDAVALERRAELAIALEEPLRADSLLVNVPPSVSVYLARAEANFDARRDSTGYAWYDSAMAYADGDSTGAMWTRCG